MKWWLLLKYRWLGFRLRRRAPCHLFSAHGKCMGCPKFPCEQKTLAWEMLIVATRLKENYGARV
jgi:hypothetical protein